MKVSYDHDHERAMADTQHWAALALRPSRSRTSRIRSRWSAWPMRCRSSRPPAAGSSRPIRTSIRLGSAYLDLGFTICVFHGPGTDQERFLRLYGEEVLPRLRHRYGAADQTRRSASSSLEVIALKGLPRISAGDDLAQLIASAIERSGVVLRTTNVLLVAQKIVSKAEARIIDLPTVEPSARALIIAAEINK